jgi:hypothetical protein
VGDISAFADASDIGDVGEFVEGDMIASSDWDTCVNAIFYLSLVPGLASTGPRICRRAMMLSCEQSLLPGFAAVLMTAALDALSASPNEQPYAIWSSVTGWPHSTLSGAWGTGFCGGQASR